MNTTESTRPFWRQGDIYFVKLDQDPDLEGAKPIKTGVIARGEQTGHMHRVSNPSLADGALLTMCGSAMYLRSGRRPTGSYAIIGETSPFHQLP